MKLTDHQDSAMRSLSNHVGKTVEVLTSQYDANVSPAYRARSVGTFKSAALRGLEIKGFIKIVDAYWKGATVTVLKCHPDYANDHQA
jgi:hypothetical protein